MRVVFFCKFSFHALQGEEEKEFSLARVGWCEIEFGHKLKTESEHHKASQIASFYDTIATKREWTEILKQKNARSFFDLFRVF